MTRTATTRTSGRTPSRARGSGLGQFERAAERYIELLGQADPREQKLLVDAVTTATNTPTGADALDENLWGPAPTAGEDSAAQIMLLRRSFADRRRLEEQSLTRDQAADLLGVSPQMVTEYLHKGDLLGLKIGRSWLIPAWEFDADAERGFLPGLCPLQRAFPGGVVTLTQWVIRPSADLDGRTPRDALVAGDVDDVLDVATTLTAAGW